ncbi:hypothetical protein FRC07_002158 [Ceratobasidium sp. 392]|nr:hypothetical protein FRC07_002158 [Ceratobasidium sp. 392]
MARIAGFSPIITTASNAHVESLKALGATHVFERTVSIETIHEVLKKDSKPLKLAVDTVSNAETQIFAFKTLTTQPNAQHTQLQLVLPPTDELQAQNNALAEGRVKAGIVAGVAHKQPEVLAPFFTGVVEKWVKENTIVPGKVELLEGGLESIQPGLDKLAKGKASILPALNASLVVEQRPIPTPNTKQVLIKITAAAINPLDNSHRYMPIRITSYPAVLGCDGAGVVEAVGSDVLDFKTGDRVFFQGDFNNDQSTFQQYALADAKLVGRTPPNITDDQASSLPSSLSTAVAALFDKTGLTPSIDGPTVANKAIVILGGSGSVGRAIVQLARIAGFSPIITTSSKAHADTLKALGATHVFERTVSADEIYSAIQASGHLFHFAVDAVSTPETQLFAYQLLANQPNSPADNLQLQLVLPPTTELSDLNKSRPEGPIKAGIVDGSSHVLPELNAPFYAVAGKWLEEGKLAPAKVQIIGGGLDGVPEALDTIAKGVSGVKLVVRPQE